MASSSVSMDLESETSHEDEQTMYTIESKSSVAGWEAIRKKLLFTVTESVGMPVGQMCVLCRENCAVVRCQQCGPQSYYCQACVDTSHSWFSFLHAMEQWTVRYLDLILHRISLSRSRILISLCPRIGCLVVRPLLLTRALECTHTGLLFNQGHTPNTVRTGFDFVFVKICDFSLLQLC